MGSTRAASAPRGRAGHPARGGELFRPALAVAAVLVFFTNFDRFFAERFGLIIPLYWIVAFGVAALLPLVARRRSDPVPIPPLILWAYGYVILSILWYVPFTLDPATAERQLRDRFVSALFLAAMTMVFSTVSAQRAAQGAVALAVVFASGINVYELLHPATFSTDFGRSAGLYINPNQSAAALVLGVICSLDAVKPRYRLLFLLVSGVGVLLTLSRAGMVGWLIVFLMFNFRKGQRLRGFLRFAAVALLVIGFLASPWHAALFDSLAERGLLTPDVQNRLNFFDSGSASDNSADTREEKASLAWTMFTEEPILGHGTGTSFEPPFHILGPHNIYLSLMVDHGIAGALLLPLFVLAVAWRAQGQARGVAATFAVFVLFWGFFSHNVLAEGYLLVTAALVAAMAAASRPATGRSGRPVMRAPQAATVGATGGP